MDDKLKYIYITEKAPDPNRPIIDITTGKELDKSSSSGWFHGDTPITRSYLKELFGDENYILADDGKGTKYFKRLGTDDDNSASFNKALEDAYRNTGLTPPDDNESQTTYYAPYFSFDNRPVELPAVYNYISSLIQGMNRPISPEQWRLQQLSNAKEVFSFLPYAGDTIDLYDVGVDFYKGNYGKAALGLGLFVVPNWLEKPGKALYRGIKNAKKKFSDKYGDQIYRLSQEANYYVDDVLHPIRTYKSIKNDTYIPLMSKLRKDEVIQQYRKDAEEALNTIPNYYNLDTKIYSPETNTWSNVYDNAYMNNGLKTLKVPTIDLLPLRPTRLFQGSYGFYMPGSHTVSAAAYDNHNVRPINRFLHTIYHEGGHGTNWKSGILNDFTTQHKDYYSLNEDNSEALHIFEPLIKKNDRGAWASSPDEFMAELAAHKGENNITTSIIYSSKQGEIANSLARRFNIDPDEALQMMWNLSAYGFKNGGTLLRNPSINTTKSSSSITSLI